MSARTRRRARTALIAVVVSVLVLAALGGLALFLAPRVLPNLTTALAESDLPVTMDADAARASVVVPSGWVYHRGWGDDAEVTLRSPDGQLSLTLAVTDAALTDAFTTAGQAASGTLGAAASERLASGLDLVHADAADSGTLVAAVGASGEASVRVIAQAPAERFGAYRAAIAGVLESVRVVP